MKPENQVILDMADEIATETQRMQDAAADLAPDLLDIASMASLYALRSEQHGVIVLEAEARVATGEDTWLVYEQQAAKLRETWPDAEAYGNAIVCLRARLYGK